MKSLSIIIVAGFILLFGACQNDESVIEQPSGYDMSPTSPLGSLILRVTQYETSRDNIIDNTNCFAVKLPVTVIANGQQVIVNSPNNFDDIQNIFSQSSTDEDTISYIFPITLVFPNHQELVVADMQQYNQTMAGCAQDQFAEIRCIDFNYPMLFNVYDTSNQIANTISVSNDVDLYNFIANPVTGEILSCDYPISMSLYDGEQLIAQSSGQMESAISDAIGTCEEPVVIEDTLPEIIINDTWYVSYYYHNEDETYNYYGYTFTFSPNGSVVAVKNSETYPGTWNVYMDGSQQMMNIDFEDSELGDLDDDWRVLEFNATNVKLRQDGGGDDPDKLYFNKN